jgi:hypothetical protein
MFELGNDAEGLPVVIKSAFILHQPRQGDFTGVTKGRMSQVVCQADSLDKVFIRAKCTSQGTPNLCHFQGMGEPGPEIIAFVIDEHLGFILKSAEAVVWKNPIAALKGYR